MAEVNQGYQRIAHSKWDCKYLVVLSPKSSEGYCFRKRGGVSREDFPCTGSAERMADSGRSRDAPIMCICIFRFPQVSRCFGD